ncbi:MAG: ABC transporter permease [Bacteroidetes bacterium]|nr:ABC transporter permease [Bacteroidota bacterium]
MRTLLHLLQKEFRQIFRDPTLLRAILIAPCLQLLVLPWAANYEVKNIQLAVMDQDRSPVSQKLKAKIFSSGYFIPAGYPHSYHDAWQFIERDKADIVMVLPRNFERTLVRENKGKIFLAVNAINGIKATVGSGYLAGIIVNFNKEIVMELFPPEKISPVPEIEITSINRFNPMMNYRTFMVPGILVMLVTMIGGMMCALNIVKEKEIGTIEQINVSPVGKFHFVLGKLIPFWIIGMVVFTIGLAIAWLVYGIIPAGSIALLYLFLSVYLLAVLGLGLLISTYSSTQQQAMSLAFFFIMIFNMMSGLFTPIESMPQWAIVIARLNPLSYFIDVMRMVVLKGSGFQDVTTHLLAVCGFAVVFNVWAVLNYRKRV